MQGEQARRVKHFHYIKWPDMKVPDKLSMLTFVQLVRSYVDDRKGCPIIVHCRSERRFILYPVYTIKQTSSNHRANIQQMHSEYTCATCALIARRLLDVCLMFAWCRLCFMYA